MRFMPHPTDPERFYYDTMTLIRPGRRPELPRARLDGFA